MKTKSTTQPVSSAAIVLICVALVTSAYANIITVTNTNDSGHGSLRQALADANDGDMIDFDPALNGRTIGLTTAELVIDKDVIINGPTTRYSCAEIAPDPTASSDTAPIQIGSAISDPRIARLLLKSPRAGWRNKSGIAKA